ncbi:MAG: PilZ domain-containing protein [Pseudomonadota bacterium]|nr:PilZ domain-containing protein [Pseudomonadota bacterium]
MSNSARRWVTRAPRYILRPEDNQFIRFAHGLTNRKSVGTMIIDMSESGMAFLVNRDHIPRLGENIMIEFEVPSKEQMACFSRVIRIEEIPRRDLWKYPERNVIVAVTFMNLTRGHRKQLNHGLNKKFEVLREQFKKTKVKEKVAWLRSYSKLALLYLACILGIVFIFYFLTQPRGNYNNLKIVPWGERRF